MARVRRDSDESLSSGSGSSGQGRVLIRYYDDEDGSGSQPTSSDALPPSSAATNTDLDSREGDFDEYDEYDYNATFAGHPSASSSRPASPPPPPTPASHHLLGPADWPYSAPQTAQDSPFLGTSPLPELSHRSASKRGYASGTTTPTLTKQEYDSYLSRHQDHHVQTTSLLRKLAGTLTAASSPVLPTSEGKRKSPGWWARRAEARRERALLNSGALGLGCSSSSSASSSTSGSTTSSPNRRCSARQHRGYNHQHRSSRRSKDRSCLSLFTAALLRQPWFPTQLWSILFSALVFACVAASVTTILVHILSNDRQPLMYRQYCQQQAPFPHAQADALAPVDVFVGVFSPDAGYERRLQIRETYARHTRPRDPVTGQVMQNVQLKFILGKPRARHQRRVAMEMETFNDIVVLDIKENMNQGKTHAYFSWAYENATVPVYYRNERTGEVGAGFKKADYVVKADDDLLIVLSELERHLRVSPRKGTYWGYLIRNLFMGGEVYALSSDLVEYVATSPALLAYTKGKEDQRVGKWMRMHPHAETINWVTERCYIYDFPKSGTTYAHGFLFPDEVERIRKEGRMGGLSDEERDRRGGDLAGAYSTVTTWKKAYAAPREGLTIEEQVEALVEGGGRWSPARTGRAGAEAWMDRKATYGVERDAVFFEVDDPRLKELKNSTYDRWPAGKDPLRAMQAGLPVGGLDDDYLRPGVPDRSEKVANARTTKFGKDLWRDLNEKEVDEIFGAAPKAKRDTIPEAEPEAPVVEAEQGPEEEQELVKPEVSVQEEGKPHWIFNRVNTPPKLDAVSELGDQASLLTPPTTTSAADPAEQTAPANEPNGQLRLGSGAYLLPDSSLAAAKRQLVAAPVLRYDTESLRVRNERMLGRPHGGTVAVHYLKRNEWFYEAFLAIVGREKTWNGGLESAPYGMPEAALLATGDDRPAGVESTPVWSGVGRVERLRSPSDLDKALAEAGHGPASAHMVNLAEGARAYGSPLLRADGYIAPGRYPTREIDLRDKKSIPGGHAQ